MGVFLLAQNHNFSCTQLNFRSHLHNANCCVFTVLGDDVKSENPIYARSVFLAKG